MIQKLVIEIDPNIALISSNCSYILGMGFVKIKYKI